MSAKREITGLKWETSLQKPPSVVSGKCLFAYMCVCVDLFSKVRVSFLFMYLALTLLFFFFKCRNCTLKFFISWSTYLVS